MKTEIKIRDMKESDVQEVLKIESACFPNPWPLDFFVEKSQPAFARTKRVADCNFLLGYCISRIVTDEMEVEKLAVHPQHRKKGVAKRLLLDGMRIAAEKNCKNAFLEVGEYNQPAIGLYESFGFKKISVRKKYYSAAENAIVMQKTF